MIMLKFLNYIREEDSVLPPITIKIIAIQHFCKGDVVFFVLSQLKSLELESDFLQLSKTKAAVLNVSVA